MESTFVLASEATACTKDWMLGKRHPAEVDVAPYHADIESGLQGAEGGCGLIRRDPRGQGHEGAAGGGIGADDVAAEDLGAGIRPADEPFDAQGLRLIEGHFDDCRLDEHLGPVGVDLGHDAPDLLHLFGRRADEQRVGRRVGGDEDLFSWGLRLLPLREQGLQCFRKVGRVRVLHVVDFDPGELLRNGDIDLAEQALEPLEVRSGIDHDEGICRGDAHQVRVARHEGSQDAYHGVRIGVFAEDGQGS